MEKKTTCTITFRDWNDPDVILNLKDFVRSLDENLRRRDEGEATASHGLGSVTIESSADRDALSTYIDAFVRHYERKGHNVTVEYS